MGVEKEDKNLREEEAQNVPSGIETEAIPIQGEAMPQMDYESIAKQLLEENAQLREYLQQMQMDNVIKRLEYLFKVVENSKSGVFSTKFLKDSAKEIEAIITIKEEDKND